MPLTAPKELIIIEVKLLKLLQQFESATQGLDISALILPPTTQEIIITENEEAKVAALFLASIDYLLRLSFTLKRQPINHVDNTNQIANDEICDLFKKVTDQYLLIKANHQNAFQYLMKKTGRQAIYCLLFSQIVHHTLWKNFDLMMQWIEDLSNTSDHVDELLLLEYAQFIIKEIEEDIYQTSIETQNPFIKAELIFRNSELNITELFLQSSVVIDYPKTSMKFSEYFFRLRTAYLVIKKLSNIDDSEIYLEFMSLFTKSSYSKAKREYPLINALNYTRADDVLHYIIDTFDSIWYYNETLGLLSNFSYISAPWHHELLLMFIFGYNKLRDYEISQGMLLSISIVMKRLIEHQSFQAVVEDPTDDMIFWNTILTLFNRPKIDVPQWSENFLFIKPVLLDHLIRLGLCDEIMALSQINQLFCSKSSRKSEDKALYSYLDSIFKIFKQLDEASKGQTFIETLVAIKSYFFNVEHFAKELNKAQLKIAPIALKARLLHRIDVFQHQIQIDKLQENEKLLLIEIGHFIVGLLNHCQANQTEIDFATKALKYESIIEANLEWFEDEASLKKETKNTKAHDCHDKKILATSLSFFVEPAHDGLIAKTDIPLSLIQFSKTIKELLGKDLILNGSAVTNLFLKRPNPNDYDCLILNSNDEELSSALTTLGYQDVKIVGKEHPTFNFNLEDGLKIDLAIYATHEKAHLPLHEQMVDILSERDFKMCALYLNLNENGNVLRVYGFNHAIRSMNQKLISIVESRIDIFEQDPIRLFRLVKLNLQYPDFKIDGFLMGIINRACKPSLFKAYFSHLEKAALHQRKIGSQIEILFSRFGLVNVLEKMEEIGLLNACFGFKFEDLKTSIPLLLEYIEILKGHINPKSLKNTTPEDYQQYLTKLGFYQFLQIHYHLKNEDTNFDKWVFKDARLRIKEADVQTYHMISEQFGIQSGAYYEFPGSLYAFIKTMKRHQKEVSDCSCSAAPGI